MLNFGGEGLHAPLHYFLIVQFSLNESTVNIMNDGGGYNGGYQPRTAAMLNQIPVGVDRIPKDCKKVNTYYSRYNGSRYYFADGGVATFAGGKYEIDAANPRNALRVDELEYVVDTPQPIFSRVPVRIVKSDSKRMRAVDRASDGVQAEEDFDEDQNMGDQPQQLSGVGIVNSQTAAVISSNSNNTAK